MKELKEGATQISGGQHSKEGLARTNDHKGKFTMEEDMIGKTGYDKSLSTIILCNTSESVCLIVAVTVLVPGSLGSYVIFLGGPLGVLERGSQGISDLCSGLNIFFENFQISSSYFRI